MYDYLTEKPKLLTDDGQRQFLKVRDAAARLCKEAGCCRMQEIWTKANLTGDSWFMLACVDRLVELGELRELNGNTVGRAGQHRIFEAVTP